MEAARFLTIVSVCDLAESIDSSVISQGMGSALR